MLVRLAMISFSSWWRRRRRNVSSDRHDPKGHWLSRAALGANAGRASGAGSVQVVWSAASLLPFPVGGIPDAAAPINRSHRRRQRRDRSPNRGTCAKSLGITGRRSLSRQDRNRFTWIMFHS